MLDNKCAYLLAYYYEKKDIFIKKLEAQNLELSEEISKLKETTKKLKETITELEYLSQEGTNFFLDESSFQEHDEDVFDISEPQSDITVVDICLHDFDALEYQEKQIEGIYSGSGEFEQRLVPPLSSSQKRIYLPVSADEYSMARDCGAKKEREYLWVENGSSAMDKCSQFLPLAFQPQGHFRLDIDLIPSTSWGASLANILTESSWRKIREQVYRDHGLRCELCGARRASKHAQRVSRRACVEAHELWEYDEDNSTQTLKGFYCLCPDCHLMFHLGFANVNGIGRQYAMLLSHYNGWSKEETIANLERVFDTHKSRSQQEWKLDVKYASNYIDLVGIKKKHADKLPTIYGLKYHIAGQKTDIYYETQ
ncbi:hypothetical protein [Kiloniella sp.]|uniref:hypothetical protein n=1 Tax=Kiloniella sp. TaxID=1938587 RepID=UPI003B01AFA3